LSVDPDQILSEKLNSALILAEPYIDNYIRTHTSQLMREGFVRIKEEDLIGHTLGTYDTRFPVLIREQFIDALGKLYPAWVVKEKASPTYGGPGSSKYVLEFSPIKKFEKTTSETKKDSEITNRADILDLGDSNVIDPE